jgi:MFS family permease
MVGRFAATTFAVLFVMSLLDYVDRWALAGVLTTLQVDLGIDDTAAGSLSSFFLVSYCLISPFMGYLGDRTRRTRLLALGVGVWSLATIGTGLAQNLTELRIARSALGIGEATYGVLAPSILMDLFTRRGRARVLSAFYLAMPLGYALGIKLGAFIAAATGSWRLAFFVVGTPGFFAAISALFLPEPVRGLSEGHDPERLKQDERVGAKAADYHDLLVNSSYTYTLLGLASYTFAFGGFAYWLPSYLERVRGFPKDEASNLVALTGFFAAVIGMSAGGWLADRLARKTPNGLFLVAGSSMLLAVPCIVAGLFARSTAMILVWLFLAQTLMFANTGPSNAVIANVVLPKMRATAYAIGTFVIHFLGDVWSPMLMGAVSDAFGQRSWMATPPGQILAALGFVPEEFHGARTNLGAGMLVVVPAVVLGGIVLLLGMRHLPREMALMQARLHAELERVASIDSALTDPELGRECGPVPPPMALPLPLEEPFP